jgi:hypothetical protein
VAKIKLNKDDWSELSQDVKNQITKILEQTGLLKVGDEITTESNAPTFSELTAKESPNLSYNLCIALCDTAQAAAFAGCENLLDPDEINACKAVAIAAGDICRSACKTIPT